jgi:hypothetical protein
MVVRSDLGMGKGKIAAQCCHACLGAVMEARRTRGDGYVERYFDSSQPKIVVKVNNEDELYVIQSFSSIMRRGTMLLRLISFDSLCVAGWGQECIVFDCEGHWSSMLSSDGCWSNSDCIRHANIHCCGSSACLSRGCCHSPFEIIVNEWRSNVTMDIMCHNMEVVEIWGREGKEGRECEWK